MRCPSCHCCNLVWQERENDYFHGIKYCKVEDMYLTESMSGLKLKEIYEETAFPLDILINKFVIKAVNKNWTKSKLNEEIIENYENDVGRKEIRRIIQDQHIRYMTWYKKMGFKIKNDASIGSSILPER